MQLIPRKQQSNLADDRLVLPNSKDKNQTKFNCHNKNINKVILDNLDKIIFAIASIYLIIILSWLVNKKTSTIPKLNATSAKMTSIPKQEISNSDAQFIKYMSQSLAAIERKIEVKKQQQEKQLQSLSNEGKVKIIEKIERVYIPVEDRLESDPGNRLNVPKPPPIKGKKNRSYNGSIPIAAALPSAIETEGNYTLVGLFESANSSIALFSINGVTQRIKINQEIGRSGWTLIGIENRTAKISRYGRVRNLSTGEEI